MAIIFLSHHFGNRSMSDDMEELLTIYRSNQTNMVKLDLMIGLLQKNPSDYEFYSKAIPYVEEIKELAKLDIENQKKEARFIELCIKNGIVPETVMKDNDPETVVEDYPKVDNTDIVDEKSPIIESTKSSCCNLI